MYMYSVATNISIIKLAVIHKDIFYIFMQVLYNDDTAISNLFLFQYIEEKYEEPLVT